MNDPNEIILNISIEKDAFMEESEEKKDEITLSEANKFNNLLLHLKENLSKRFYKKTIIEIDSLLEVENVDNQSLSWKLYILKIRATLSIIKNKIRKYLIIQMEKKRINYHINRIRKYLNKIPIEFTNFFENHKNIEMHKNLELINDLLYCYLDYIFTISFFHKKTGNIIDAIAYLSFIIRLYKETKLIPKTKEVLNKFEKCFLFLINIYICNEDYSIALGYLNIVMDICLENIIYQTDDLNDGVFTFDKGKTIYKKEKKLYKINSLKKIIPNIIFVFLYRSICYENTRKIIKAIKCDYQSIWFLNHFYSKKFRYIYYLSKNILEKRNELKNALYLVEKKINYFEIRKKRKKNEEKNKKEREMKHKSKSLFSFKFNNLVQKLDNLKITEIDLVNKFEEKKNLKGANSQSIEGKDKNTFLYGIRLYNTFLREDFRPIMNNMQKIKSFDFEYQEKEKIQKFLRRIYFNQNQRNIRLNSMNQQKKNLHLSLPNYSQKIKIKRNVLKNKGFASSKTKFKIFSDMIKTKTNTFISNENILRVNSTKNKSINSIKYFNKNESLEKGKELKIKKIPKYKILKLTSICDGKEVYKENENLNKFFNKKYLAKRAYVKKLEEREIIFQKHVLREKNHPKIPFTPYNEEIIKRKVKNRCQEILSLSTTNPQTWKENLTREEYRKIRIFNRLESAAICSLDGSALMKFKEEEKKMKKNKFIFFDENENHKIKVNDENKSMIEKLNFNLEQIDQRESIETKNFQKLYEENKKYIKHRSERNSPFLLRKEKEKEKEKEIETIY